MFAERFRTVYAQMNNKRKIDSLKLRLLSSEKNALTLSNDLPKGSLLLRRAFQNRVKILQMQRCAREHKQKQELVQPLRFYCVCFIVEYYNPFSTNQSLVNCFTEKKWMVLFSFLNLGGTSEDRCFPGLALSAIKTATKTIPLQSLVRTDPMSWNIDEQHRW